MLLKQLWNWFTNLDAQEATVISLIDDWNEGVKITKKQVDDHNKQILEDAAAGTISAEAALKGLLGPPERLVHPTTSWCRHFLKNYGYSLLSKGCDSQAWLPYSHPSMKAARDYVRDLLQHHVHGGLMLNYDQVWRVAFTWGGKLLWKERDQVGQRAKKRRIDPKEDKKLHHIKGSRRSITVSWMTQGQTED